MLDNQKQSLDEKKEENKMIMNTKDALEMYQKAKGVSQMNAVDTDFDILNDSDEDEL